MNQEFGSRLARWCWPRVSHVVDIGMPAGTTVIWRLDFTERHCWLNHIITVGKRPQLLTVKLLEYLWLLTCPRGNWSKRVSSPFNFSHSSRCVLMYCAFSFISLMINAIKYLSLYWVPFQYFCYSSFSFLYFLFVFWIFVFLALCLCFMDALFFLLAYMTLRAMPPVSL